MVFINVAYATTVPLLLLVTWLGNAWWKKYAIAVLSVTNLLLILHSLFIARQLLGMFWLAKAVTAQLNLQSYPLPYHTDWFTIRLALMLLLPFLFLYRKYRNNVWISAGMLLLYGGMLDGWGNHGNLVLKILNYLSLLCGAYALLWLRKLLPFQKDNR